MNRSVSRMLFMAAACALMAFMATSCGKQTASDKPAGDTSAVSTASAGNAVTAEEQKNIDVSREFLDKVFGHNDTAFLEQHVDANYIEHNAQPGQVPGIAGFKKFVAEWVTAFPDSKIVIDEIFAKGDRVVILSRQTGTNTGAFMGKPATNKKINVPNIDIVRIKDGKMVEHWGLGDMMACMTQLGMMPADDHAGATSAEVKPMTSAVPPGSDATADEQKNVEVTREFMDKVFNHNDTAFLEQHVDPNFVEHVVVPGQEPGIAGLKKWVNMWFTGFPDGKTTVDDIFGKGDRVVIISTQTGTNSGPFMGMPASNKKVSVGGIDVVRIKDGKMVEHWGVSDMMAFMTQLGKMPADDHASAAPGAPHSGTMAADAAKKPADTTKK
jgi:steroid delta-isomerase-like uncharacterized protein